LAAFIVNNAHSIVPMSIVELAELSETSTATVSRFCRTFHFNSFGDFRMKLSIDLAHEKQGQSYQDIVEGNPLNQIVAAIEANHIQSIVDTTRILDLTQTANAIQALKTAQHIAIFGMATSGLVAQDFLQKLTCIGKKASAHTDSHMQITSAASLTKEDIAVAISYSGDTPETNDALIAAKERGCKTIAVTRFAVTPLSSIADIKLFTSSLEAGMRRGDMASRIAQLHVVDILFTGLVSEFFDEYVPNLEQSYRIVEQYRKGTRKAAQ
jgi:DNA-binding MurR/RpiR family transcriptional regulator